MGGGNYAGGNNHKTRRRHEIDGTFRKDRHANLRNPDPPTGRPDELPGLDGSGQLEWSRMLRRLEDSQALWKVDDAAIYQYCRLWAETEHVSEQQAEARASLKILEDNLPDVGQMDPADRLAFFGQIVTLQKAILKCTDQLRQGRMAIRQYLIEFGLTPASRSRVKLPPKDEAVDEFAAFQRLRQIK